MTTLRNAFLVGLLLAVPFAACSSDDAEETTTTTAGAPTTPAVVAPIIVDGPEQLSVEAGAVIDIVTEGVTEVTSSDDSVLQVTQPSDDGSAQFNAGATAVGAGSATLTVLGESGDELYVVDIDVS